VATTDQQYPTINGFPIIVEAPFRGGSRPGSVILVDKGDEYVVARRYQNESTGEPYSEWDQGEYFPYLKGHRTTSKRGTIAK
jgi:hypothetical protein